MNGSAAAMAKHVAFSLSLRLIIECARGEISDLRFHISNFRLRITQIILKFEILNLKFLGSPPDSSEPINQIQHEPRYH